MNKKLRRSNTDKVIAGVCGGFGEYFDVDPIILRVAWVLFAFLPGAPGILVYLISALVIPKDDGFIYEDTSESSSSNTSNTPVFIGLGFVLLGGFMLTRIIWPNLTFRLMSFLKYWPILFILLGVYIIINQKDRK